jgi:hypothetical protein
LALLRDLGRHRPVPLRVRGAPHRAEGAQADLLDELEVGDGLGAGLVRDPSPPRRPG